MRENNNIDFLDMLTIFSVILQIQGAESDMNSTSNDDLMRELQRVDREYLEKIVKQNEEILKILQELTK